MRWTIRLACACLIVLCSSFLAPSTAGKGPVLTILHFNDDYQLSAMDGGKAGGLDRLAALVKQYRQHDRYTLLLFAGDLLSPSAESSVFRGRQLIDGLNRLGIDGAVFGNHEFDYGPAELQARVAESRFPWLATNTFAPGLRPFPGSRQYLLLPIAGVTIGIFGLTTPETATSSSPGATTFGDPIAVGKAIVSILRRTGVQVIIALTHLSMSDDQRLLREIPDVDLVIGGHDHEPMTARVGGRLVAKAGVDARWLGVTQLSLDGTRTATHTLAPITDKTPSDPAMAAAIQRYTDLLTMELDVVIGETLVPLDARSVIVRQQEAPLGNFIADAIRTAVQADLAIINGGGIRSDSVLAAGPVRRKNVLAWLPFGNVVVKVAVRGAAIRESLENGVSQVEQLGGRFPHVSGLRFAFNPSRPAGSRVQEIRVGDAPLNEETIYTVATNDFMLRGGDGYGMLSKGDVLINTAGGPLMATVVVDAIRKNQPINPKPEGRITVAR
jgi:2',3'-cyclic-nucleotide 2'-phosphodiesterase (5'-nucleotidase family)